MNIIIYNDLRDEEIFLNSLNNNTKIIKYTDNTNIDELLNMIELDISNIYIGFVYHYPGYNYIPFFNREINKDIEGFENKYIKSEFLQLLEYIKNKNIIIDLLTCNVNDKYFINELNNIYNNYNITIRYSTNDKGNLSDWIQESHNIDIKNIYFNNNIYNWNYLLNNTTNILNITDSNGNVFELIDNIYYLKRNIIWNTNNLNITNNTDFIQLKDNEILDGNGYTIYFNFSPVGIIGTNVIDPNNKPIIRNLNIFFYNLSLASGNHGGLVRRDQHYFIVSNCNIYGNPSDIGGGVAGRYCANFLIKNCTQYGTCTAWGSGGIIGGNATGNCIVRNCIHFGQINQQSGGIAGNNNPEINSSLIIKNCASYGIIASSNGGGITGFGNANRSGAYLLIENCFTVGEINNNDGAGGIVGLNTGYDGGRCIIRNCYTTGDIISTNSGGITGKGSGHNTLIENCYVLGRVIGSSSGAISGSLTSGPTIRNCVYNSTTVVGGGTFIDGGNNSNNLSPIENKIPNNWNVNIWKLKNISSLSNDEWNMIAYARAIYGLKILKPDYNGPIIRIRRSNDNLEDDFYGTFNNLNIKDLVNSSSITLLNWLGSNNGFVVTWYDQSVYKNNLTQTTTSFQPTVNLTENSIVFSTSFLNKSGGVLSASSNKYTYIANWKSNVNNATQVIMEQNTSSVIVSRRGALLILNNGFYGFNGQNNDIHFISYSITTFNKTIMSVNNSLNNNVEILHNLRTFQGRTGDPSTLNLGDDIFIVGRKVNESEYFNGAIRNILVFQNTFDNLKLDVLYRKISNPIYPTLNVFDKYPFSLTYKTYDDLPKLFNNVSKIENTNFNLKYEILRYPPKAGTLTSNTLTQDNFTITNENYGNGEYISRSSSSHSLGYSSVKVFDYSNNENGGSWASSVAMSNDTGRVVNNKKVYSYNQTTHSLNINGTITYGQWISLETPMRFKVYKYGILPRYPSIVFNENNRQPVNFMLLGSNDNSIWYELHNEYKTRDFDDFSITSPNETKYFLVLSKTKYKFHALFVTAMTSNENTPSQGIVPPSLDIAEFELYGYDNQPLLGNRYPPIPLLNNTSNIENQSYGNGTYNIIPSLENAIHPAFNIFSYSPDVMNYWTPEDINGTYILHQEYNISEIPNATKSIFQRYVGYTLSIQLPEPIYLRNYIIRPRMNRTRGSVTPPSRWVLFGSNNNVNWVLIDLQNKTQKYEGYDEGLDTTSDSTIGGIKNVNSNDRYRYYTFVFTHLIASFSTTIAAIKVGQIELYGDPFVNNQSIYYNTNQDTTLDLSIYQNPIVNNYNLNTGRRGVLSKFKISGNPEQLNDGVYIGISSGLKNINSNLKIYKIDNSNNFIENNNYPITSYFNNPDIKDNIIFDTQPMIYLKSSDITSSLYVSEWNNVYGNNAIGINLGNTELPIIIRDEYPNYVRLGSGLTSNINGNYFDLGELTFNTSTNGGFTFIGLTRFNSFNSTWERIFDFGNNSNDNNIVLARSSSSNVYALSYYINSTTGDRTSNLKINKGEWEVIAMRITPNQSTLITLDGSFNSTTNTLTNRTLTRNYIGRSNWVGDNFSNLDIVEFMVFDYGLNIEEIENIRSQLIYKYNLIRTSNYKVNLWNSIIPTLSDIDILFNIKPVIYLRSSDIPDTQYITTWKNHYGSNAVGNKTGTANLPELKKDQYPQYVRIGTGISSTINGNWFNLGSYTFNALSNNGFTFIGVVKWWGDITQFGRIFDFGNGQNSDNIILYRQGTNLNYASLWWNGTNPNSSNRSDYFHNTFERDVWDVVAIRFRTNQRYFSNMNGSNTKTVQDSNSNLPMTNRTLSNTYIGRSNWAEAFANLDIREFMVFDRGLEISEIENIRKQLISKYNLEIKEYQYPPSAGTNIEITNNGRNVSWEIRGQNYGNGNYSSYSSRIYQDDTATLYPTLLSSYDMFNYETGDIGWHSFDPPFNSRFNDVNNCDFAVIILPERIKLKRYILYSRPILPTRAPKDWRIYGSNDNTNWILIDVKSNIIGWVDNVPREFNVDYIMSDNHLFNNNNFYNHFAIVVTSTVSLPSLQIAEWQLFGEQDRDYNYNRLYEYILLEDSVPNTLIGGDPYILELGKNIKSKAFIISNTWNEYYLYKSDEYKVIGYNNILDKDIILKMKKYINGIEYNLDKKYLRISKFKYLTNIKVLFNNNVELEIDTINGNIINNNINNINLKYEKIETNNGLSLIRKNINYPKKNFIAYCLYVDNNMIVIKIDNYWVELNNVKIYLNHNNNNINNKISGELIKHSILNKIN